MVRFILQSEQLHSIPSSHRCTCSAPAASSKAAQEPYRRSALLRRGFPATTLSALSWHLGKSSADAAGVIPLDTSQDGKVAMRTLSGSELAIGFYPKFNYDSSGGGGVANASRSGSHRLNLEFDPSSVAIPDVDGTSTTFLGVPMLPYLRISIQPTKLEGHIDLDTGLTELSFDAKFLFNAGPLYKAPPLYVNTLLTTESVQSRHHKKQGSRLDKNGLATLVGVANIAITGDPLLDNFLQLPTDVMALMASQFSVTL